MNLDDRDAVNEAEGLMELGLFEDALEFIDSLPPGFLTIPGLLRVKMLCAMGLKNFEMAETLAIFLGGDEAFRELAGKILHELAAIHAAAGDLAKARELVRITVKIYPDQRVAMLDDGRLDGMF